ncbi:hypothetical protein TSAR_004292 [Trichomalopsis sarcophagae]|uniref:Uncharacterized protein n=1 Tax=Trichomalopsis sarcophagae TaxID=543379 RepID=A0A232EI57_9HYME|nr:hypothetical protein TSAR_004292 [Trichomalopsis sarcophagae]
MLDGFLISHDAYVLLVDSYNNFWESLFPNWTTCLNASDNEIQDYCKYFNCTLICEKFIGSKIPEIFAKKNILTMTFRTSSLPILKEDFFRDYPNLRNEL